MHILKYRFHRNNLKNHVSFYKMSNLFHHSKQKKCTLALSTLYVLLFNLKLLMDLPSWILHVVRSDSWPIICWEYTNEYAGISGKSWEGSWARIWNLLDEAQGQPLTRSPTGTMRPGPQCLISLGPTMPRQGLTTEQVLNKHVQNEPVGKLLARPSFSQGFFPLAIEWE